MPGSEGIAFALRKTCEKGEETQVKSTRIKILSVLLALAMIISGCSMNPSANGNGGNTNGKNTSDGKLSVVTTIFPEYDWTKNLLGDNPGNIDLTMLLGSGVDLHSYQPTAEDILAIENCDMFIYVGGESDEWVEDVLNRTPNENRVVINLLKVLGGDAKEEEIVEGMEAEEEEEGEESEEGEEEYDEHVWLSLRCAGIFCEAIEEGLVTIDSANKETYEKNLAGYKSELEALNGKYAEACESASHKTLLFGDRFPFRYLTDDYGLVYYAAFAGCSAESEASFKTILFLAEKLDEYHLPAILTIESSDGRIAQAVRDNTEEKNQKILVLNSMQSVTDSDVKNGVTYLGIMEENLEVLKEALK
jgi:zinc transport system substrate-binding protein